MDDRGDMEDFFYDAVYEYRKHKHEQYSERQELKEVERFVWLSRIDTDN